MRCFKFILSSFLTLIVLVMIQTVIQASSPVIRVGKLETGICNATGEENVSVITEIQGYDDIDTFTRDSLPQELSPSYPIEALKAQAVLIRSVANYRHQHPQTHWFCNNTGQPFELNTETIAGWLKGRGAWQGNSDNMTNDRVTDTMSQVLRDDGLDFDTKFNSCIQAVLVHLAQQGLNYIQILTDPHQGIYSGLYTHCNNPLNDTSFARRTGLTVNNAYHYIPSLTNGTSPHSVSGASQTSYVTPVPDPRHAESYWGHSGMDLVLYQPFNQPGFYISGWPGGDKTEYLMEFGGLYENLHLIGISDIPGPIILTVYIDGYFKDTLQWVENDNRRHLRVGKIRNIPHGTHAIAIEFAEDYCHCGDSYSANGDRNFYFDVLGVNDGPIHQVEEDSSPFFSIYQFLYLPLIIR